MNKQIKGLGVVVLLTAITATIGLGFVKLDEKYKQSNEVMETHIEHLESVIEEREVIINTLQSENFDLQDQYNVLLQEKEEVEREFEAYREQFKGISKMEVEATAYTHTGNPTATGVMPQVGVTIAVDPNVIPLGSDVYVEGFGWRKAQDTGGLIKGKIIDIFMDTRSEAIQWGRRKVEIYVKK